MAIKALRRVKIGLGSLGTFVLVVLGACIQGPWDFYPDNPSNFRGVTVYGYALAGRPLNNICFEPMLDLASEATSAFAFYDSAQVRVTGSFNGSVQTLTLSALDSLPNCFAGEPTALVERGETYLLDARMNWDSSGRRVISQLISRAQVPDSFSIGRAATAPSLARGDVSPGNIFTLEFLNSLPPTVQEVMIKEYGDTLVKLQRDTLALAEYLKTNAIKIQGRLKELLKDDTYFYQEGDTLLYLTGILNTLAHYYSSVRSPDVNSVLISQRFDPEGGRPDNRFDGLIGLTPKAAESYFPGDIRRLSIYPNATGPNGWNLLDSLGIINSFFHTGLNRFYFYGFEKAYYEYLSTNGVGGRRSDTKSKPKSNVTGGRGVFAGAIPDSFDLYIKIDSLTRSFQLPVAHAAFCNDEGWESNKDCRQYYRGYCTLKGWGPPECRQDALESCMEADLDHLEELKNDCSPVAEIAMLDTALARRATTRFCISMDFPSADPACAEFKVQCLETKGLNTCKQPLWDFCLDKNWKPRQCQLGLVSYCKDKPRLSEVLCRHADEYCRNNPSENLCN